MRRPAVTKAAAPLDRAAAELRHRIVELYPQASVTVFQGSDPEGIYLRVAVDLADPDEVLDPLVDRLYELQVEQGLAVYVLPVRTPERLAALLEAK